MNAVATIIRRHLLGRRAVSIPEIGTLSLTEHAAQFTEDNRRMTAAVRELLLTDEQSISIMQYIEWETGEDRDQATELYNQWLEKAVDGECLIIEGVCTISLKDFVLETDAEFWALANPVAGERIVVNTVTPPIVAQPLRPTRKRGSGAMVISIICAVAAAAYLVYYFADDILTLIDKIQ